MENFLDLFYGQYPPARTKPFGGCRRVVAGMMDDVDQDVDNQQWVRWEYRRGGADLELSPRGRLLGGFLRICAQVNVDILEELARNASVSH